MIRAGRSLSLGCLLLLASACALAGGNSLLIPATSRCALEGEPEQLAEALTVCEAAAVEGDTQAAYELGEFHYQKQADERDLAQAVHWFEQASLQGHAHAQHRLGMMFYLGEGVPANNTQAFIVLKIAAVNGEEDALDSADRVSEHMPRAELETATQVLGHIFREYLRQSEQADEPR